MTEDSTPELRTKGLLEKNLYKLENRFNDQEENLEKLDCFLFQLNADQEEDRTKIEKLGGRIRELEVRLESVEESAVGQEELDEGDQKIDLLEERVSVLKVQNIELRNHLNLMIDTLNGVVKILNSQVINEEPTDETAEATTPHEENPDGEQDMSEDTQHTLKKVYAKYEVTTPHEDMDEDTQPTLSQVYAMYQSQPPDEEDWDEMTSVIEVAEEREVRKKVNGMYQCQPPNNPTEEYEVRKKSERPY